MLYAEQPLVIECAGESMLGILSVPVAPATRGVLVIVGGPQYRAGSHRQFTLLARELAAEGAPVLRFDYRGMGDSSGDTRDFEQIELDIACALDRFFAAVPAMREVVIWGLCDAASAALFYAHRDARVTGLVLANPWVRTEQGEARAYLRHYYVQRILQPEFWRKVARGEWNVREAAGALKQLAAKAFAADTREAQRQTTQPSASSLPDRMAEGLRRFGGRVLLVLSGNDLVAKEFVDEAARSPSWRRLLGEERITRHDLAEANHTFARREWRDQVARLTCAWVKSW